MDPSNRVRRFTSLIFSLAAASHAATGFAGTVSVDLTTSIEQVVAGPVTAGEPFQLHWVIANNATNISSQALGRLQFNANSEFIEASCPSTFDAGVLVWTPPSVDSAAPRQCTVSVRSADVKVLQFDASVETSGSDSDFDLTNNADSLVVDVESGANPVDLAVTLAQIVDGPVIGNDAFDLRLEIANNLDGSVSSQARGRVLLPPQLEVMSASCNPSPEDTGDGFLEWTPPSVSNGAPRQCDFRVRYDGNGPTVLSFAVQVESSSQDVDENLGNNSAILLVSIQGGGAVVAQELPAVGWPAGLAMMSGLIACVAVLRRRLGRDSFGANAR